MRCKIGCVTLTRLHPTTGRRMDLIEAEPDRTLTDDLFFWLELVTGERIPATDEEIREALDGR